ncbi:MAG: hypothetical protein KIH01_01970 [Candidatus Freyarchaeota archaeon]|nr:hypothetical protein [Candidatus Jordarchaeia archaeon]
MAELLGGYGRSPLECADKQPSNEEAMVAACQRVVAHPIRRLAIKGEATTNSP